CLQQHPAICWGLRKEIHFFDSERDFRGKKPRYSKYHAFFDPKPFHKVVGEATPIYMYWYDAPKRIWQYNPNMKLIMILRNPIERAYSHWNLTRHRAPDVSFWDAIQNERERCRSALPLQHRYFSYVDRGFYVQQLHRLWTYFDRKQTLIVRSEDLRSTPGEVVDKICRFLEIDGLVDVKPPAERPLRYPYPGPMGQKERDYLRHVYEYEIRSLERILGWDCSRWLDG
ncbi:MAG TPA: sulfotransferase domain-containing protein, partial [Candidatus Binatia bacterium]|nr:sulfotransferase domain-containing protein [Candidatus Binatia bacterium]